VKDIKKFFFMISFHALSQAHGARMRKYRRITMDHYWSLVIVTVFTSREGGHLGGKFDGNLHVIIDHANSISY
jgi:hypothetical protein